MKNRIDKIKAEIAEIEAEINSYIEDYSGMTEGDKVDYNIGGWCAISVQGVGKATFYSSTELTDITILHECETKRPETVEEFIAYKAEKERKSKTIPRALLALKYIVGV